MLVIVVWWTDVKVEPDLAAVCIGLQVFSSLWHLDNTALSTPARMWSRIHPRRIRMDSLRPSGSSVHRSRPVDALIRRHSHVALVSDGAVHVWLWTVLNIRDCIVTSAGLVLNNCIFVVVLRPLVCSQRQNIFCCRSFFILLRSPSYRYVSTSVTRLTPSKASEMLLSVLFAILDATQPSETPSREVG